MTRDEETREGSINVPEARMRARVNRSGELFKCSWEVLCADKRLALFPVLSAACTLLMAAAFLAPVLTVSPLRAELGPFAEDVGGVLAPAPAADPAAAPGEDPVPAGQRAPAPRLTVLDVGFLLYGFTFFFACSFVVVFFNAALIGAANLAFDGRPTGLRAGLGVAWSRLPQIIAWSLVNAVAGTLLRVLEKNVGWLGRIVIALVGLAWSIAVYLAVPTLVIEGVGPVKAIRNSVGAITRTWGEGLVIAIGFRYLGALVSVVGVLTIVAGVAILAGLAGANHPLAGVGLGGLVCSVGVGILVLWSVVSSTLMAITRTALYRFAVDGLVPEGFTKPALAGAFVERRQHDPR